MEAGDDPRGKQQTQDNKSAAAVRLRLVPAGIDGEEFTPQRYAWHLPAMPAQGAGAPGHQNRGGRMKKIKFAKKTMVENGVVDVIDVFLHRARQSSREAMRYRKLHNAGDGWVFGDLLRARAERFNWVWAARLLRDRVSANPPPNLCTKRRVARILREAA